MNFGPDTTINIEYLITLILFLIAISKYLKGVRKDTSEESIKQTESLLKANMKLDQLCGDSRETRIEVRGISDRLEAMSKKQLEHDLRLENVCDRIEKLESMVLPHETN